MSEIKMSKYDLLNEFQAFSSEATFVGGNKSTHQMVAMIDIEKVVDRIITKLGNGQNYISNNS
jgi:hypothetical protein